MTIISIFQRRKLRPREDKQIAQSHRETVSDRARTAAWVCLTPKPVTIAIRLYRLAFSMIRS